MSPADLIALTEMARAWHSSMRTSYVGRRGIDAKPIPPWEELSPSDQSVLIKALGAAIRAGQPDVLCRINAGL